MVVWIPVPKIFREARSRHVNSACPVTAGSGAANGDIEVSDPTPCMDSRPDQNWSGGLRDSLQEGYGRPQ
jgi:hypothetical protein